MLAGWHSFLDNLRKALDEPTGRFGFGDSDAAHGDPGVVDDGVDLIAAYRSEILASAVLAQSQPEAATPDEGQQRDILVELFTGRTDDEVAELAAEFGGMDRLCHAVMHEIQNRLATLNVAPRDADLRVGVRTQEGVWSLLISDGTSRVERRISEGVRAVVTTTGTDFLRLVTSDLKLDEAVARRRASVDGDAREAGRLVALSGEQV